jgi:trehalose utilization protein
VNITVWNEHVHEQDGGAAARIYPDRIHAALASFLSPLGPISTATLAQPQHGLPASMLDATDVLLWWGHAAHDAVSDDVVSRVVERVWAGMGLVVLHRRLNGFEW